MEKHVIDEKTGISYTLHGEHYLPDLIAPEIPPLGKYGMLRREYLRKQKNGLYTGMLLSGKLDKHLAEIDRQAQEMEKLLIEQMAKAEGITEMLKSENQMEWAGRMTSIAARAMEIVDAELIYT